VHQLVRQCPEFCVRAVSGTVLSFELGLLWPLFVRYAGAVIGMPFSLEGFAYFTEAIFLGIYLHGWNKIPSWFHFLSGLIAALSGLTSAMFVTLVNGWMNTPTGLVQADGEFTDIRPFAAMLNPAGMPEGVHMILAACAGAGFKRERLREYLDVSISTKDRFYG
jgi:cytochrome d ubiquinol oxidase subunit I